MRVTFVRLAAAISVLLCVPGVASAKWTRLQSPHFVFVGDASERSIRQVATHLEQFRTVMIGVLPNSLANSPVPTTVFVFKDLASLGPYRYLYKGRPVEVAGYFLGHEDANVIAIDANAEEASLSTVFHEYTHFLAGNTLGPLPPWVNEGLAEVYRTFEERGGGQSAVIGIPSAAHLRLLNTTALMPVRDLLAVGYTSPVYNEGNRRGVFYAESWALVHYLMLGSPARHGQFSQYLLRIQNGVEDDAAFRQSFGDDVGALERELHQYLMKFAFNAVKIDFDQKVTGGVTARGETIADAEADAYLGDLLARLGRVDEARARLRKLLDAKPPAATAAASAGSARAACALGLLELREGHPELARPLLEEAAQASPDDGFVQGALGRVLLASLSQETGSAALATLAEARAVLAKAVVLSPDAAETLVQFARAELKAQGDVARARAAVERAAKLAPAREHYRLLLAEALLEQQDIEHATAYLGPLMAHGSRPQIRDSARQLLGSIADRAHGMTLAENVPGVLSDLPDAPDDLEPPDIPEPPAATTAPPPPSKPAPAGGRFVPALRELADGEARVRGMFTAVECDASGIAFVITVDGRPFRMRASTFDQIDFITYRQDSPGSVACGPQSRPWPVIATYRAGRTGTSTESAPPQGVAIELLPDDYK